MLYSSRPGLVTQHHIGVVFVGDGLLDVRRLDVVGAGELVSDVLVSNLFVRHARALLVAIFAKFALHAFPGLCLIIHHRTVSESLFPTYFRTFWNF